MKETKRIALVAHDERKKDLISSPSFNRAYEQELKDYSTTIRRPI